jgi:hypothetical protein
VQVFPAFFFLTAYNTSRTAREAYSRDVLS